MTTSRGRPTTSWPAAPAPVVGAPLPPAPVQPRIKVLHVVARLAGGGGANVVLSALGTDRDRYEPWIFGGDRASEGALWAAAAAGGVRTVVSAGMGPGRDPADIPALIRLVRLIRRERFAIVHTHSRKAGLIGGLAARVCRVPVIVHTFHTRVFSGTRRPPPYGRLERVIRRLAHAYIAISPALACQAVRTRSAVPGRLRVIASAVDMAAIPREFDPGARASLGIAPHVTVVGTVGRIESEKGHADFVRMAAEVRETHPATAFVIIGNGSLATEVRQLATASGVTLDMTGHRADAAQLAAGFDVFVMTSVREGLGRALIEALASGRPCVAPAVDGIPDLISHGATGLLSEPGDPSSAAAAVRWMIDNPERAREMGRNGRRRIRDDSTVFTPQAMCAAIDACYRELLGLPANSPARSGREAP